MKTIEELAFQLEAIHKNNLFVGRKGINKTLKGFRRVKEVIKAASYLGIVATWPGPFKKIWNLEVKLVHKRELRERDWQRCVKAVPKTSGEFLVDGSDWPDRLLARSNDVKEIFNKLVRE